MTLNVPVTRCEKVRYDTKKKKRGKWCRSDWKWNKKERRKEHGDVHSHKSIPWLIIERRTSFPVTQDAVGPNVSRSTSADEEPLVQTGRNGPRRRDQWEIMSCLDTDKLLVSQRSSEFRTTSCRTSQFHSSTEIQRDQMNLKKCLFYTYKLSY